MKTVSEGMLPAIQALIAAAPGKITVTSGIRSRAEQQRLYDAYKAGKGNLAAKPGTSKHESGQAVDLHFENDAVRQWAHANAAKFGLVFPIQGEPWHVEMASAKKGGAVPAAQPAPAKPVEKKTAQDYGFAQAFFNSDKELKKLLADTLANGWTPERFQAELKNTRWYKTHTEAQRQWIALNTSDHSTAKRQVDIKMKEIGDLARAMGAELSGLEIHDLAVNVLYKGLTDPEVKALVSSHIEANKKGQFAGAAGATQTSLKALAAQYGITMTQGQQERWIKDMASGMKTDNDFQVWLREQSKILYPNLAGVIDKGLSVDDVAGNYTQRMAQILELDPTQIDFAKDPLIQKALQYRDPNGKGDGMPMPLWQFEAELRSDPRWLKTSNAMNSFASVTHQVLSDMGLVS